MIKASQIKSDTTVKAILDDFKPLNEYLNTLNENSAEYENLCDKVAEQYCEIEIFWSDGDDIHICDEHNLAIADCIGFRFWDYIKGDIEFAVLKNDVKKLISEYKD